MNKSTATLLALALVSAGVLLAWFALEGGPRGSTVADAPAPNAEERDGKPAEAPDLRAASEVPAAAPTDVVADAPAAPAADERRAVAEEASDASWAGRVSFPAGAPDDDTLRVIALDKSLGLSSVYGQDGVLAALAKGEKKNILATAPVAADGGFVLTPTTASAAWLVLDGRFLSSAEPTQAKGGQKDLELVAELGACVTGSLQPPEGSTRAEAELELTPDSDEFGNRTVLFLRKAALDAEGRFEFRAVRAGPQRLSARSPSFAPWEQKGLALEAGQVLDVVVRPGIGASVSGRVLDERGAAVAGAKVKAAKSEFWGFSGRELRSTESGADGSFALEHVGTGKSVLIASTEGRLESENMPLELADGQSRSGLVLKVEDGAFLRGHVTLPGGVPASTATVDVSFDPAAMTGMGAMNMARGAKGKTTVGEDGAFAVGGLGKGPFLVRATLERPGADGKPDVWGAKAAGVQPGTSDLALELAAPAVLAGRVLDPEGKPVTDFTLRTTEVGAAWFDKGLAKDEHVQDENGAFALRSLAAGAWRVEARAKGFGPHTPVEVTLPRTDPEPLVLTLVPAATVAGTVLDPTGTPVAGALVTLEVDLAKMMENLGGATSPATMSDEHGAFLLEGLAPGSNAIYAQRDGLAPSASVTVQLDPAEAEAGVTLRLRQGALVTGEVFGIDGKPAAGVRVLAQLTGTATNRSQSADGVGQFRFEHLQPGAWSIVALFEAQSVAGKEGGDATAAIMENMKFTIVQLEDGEEEHVVLGAPPKDPVRVHGHVRHGDRPVSGGMISFMAEGAKGLESLKMASIGAEGAYEAELSEPGRYLVSVQVGGMAGVGDPQDNVEQRCTVPEAEEYVLDLALPLAGIAGRVRGPDGEALAGARVSLGVEGGMQTGTMLGGHYAEGKTDEEGRYRFQYLRPGSYSVAAGGSPFGGALGSDSKGGRIVRSGLRVEEGRMLEDVDFRLEEPCNITGTVVDAAGLPVKDATVFVRDANGRLLDRLSMTTSAGDGHFRYTGVAPGEYQIAARAASVASAEIESVRVRAGETGDVKLVLTAGTTLVVEVLDGEGKPLEALLSVTDARGREVQAMIGMGEIMSAMGDGIQFDSQRIGPLPPGTYTVTARAGGDESSRSVTLDGQPERHLKVRLK